MLAAPAQGAMTAPVPLDPGNGASFQAIPPFAWSPVPGADQYQFQVAADQNFNSPVLGQGEGNFVTKNTRATLKKTLPNGRYWWRVRATTKKGDASPWSTPRSFIKSWTAVPSSMTPGPGYPFTFPVDAHDARLVARSVRRELHVLPGQRPCARQHRRQQRPAGRDLGDELRARLQPASLRHVLLERRPGRLRGQQGDAVAGLLVHVVLAVDHDPARERPDVRRRDVRPAVLVGPGPRRDEVRGRGQLVGRLRARLEGLLRAADDVDVAGADRRVPRQHVLLARPRARRGRQRRRLEPRARLHQDVRQGAARDCAEHQEPAHARQSGRPRHRRRPRHGRLPDEGSDPQVGLRPGRLRLPRRRRSVQREHLRVGNRLARDDVDPVVVAARHGWNNIKPYPDAMPVAYDGLRPHAEPAVLRSRPREGRARHGRPGRLRRLHIPRRRHGRRVPVDGISDRRRVHAVLQSRLPGRGRLHASRLAAR